MACSYDDRYKDLTICGICLMVIEEPKALPCLHSYCLKCLCKWAKGKEGKVTCPICVQDFVIPSEGIKGFTTNFFINTLKDRRETAKTLEAKDAVITCYSCEKSNHKADAYCTDCGGFICLECSKAHDSIRSLKTHKTVPFADLQNGKVDIRNVSKIKYCKGHEGQVMRFYCKTCGVLICHECTVIDHPGTSHVLVTLKCINKEQREDIEHLKKSCTKVKTKVEKALKDINEPYQKLEENVKMAREDLQKTVNAFMANVKQKAKDLDGEIAQLATDNKKQIDAHKDSLQLQQTRLQTALQMATELTEKGSDYDLALVYSSLKNNLTQLQEMELAEETEVNIQQFEFKPNSHRPTIPSIGSIRILTQKTRRRKRGGIGKWKLIKHFATDGEGMVEDGRGIAVAPAGNIVVSAFGKSSTVKIYNHEGDYTSCINREYITYNVVVNVDGLIFVTSLRQDTVNVYESCGTFKFNFKTTYTSPNDLLSKTFGQSHGGLAIDNHGHLLVGEIKTKYISRHQQDGVQINMYKVNMQPYFIAVTSNDEIIISDHDRSTVELLDKTGTLKRKFESPGKRWCPRGICCTADVVYIADSTSRTGGIHCYSMIGQYLGKCITQDVIGPTSLTMTENGEKLLVVGRIGVKVFQRQ